MLQNDPLYVSAATTEQSVFSALSSDGGKMSCQNWTATVRHYSIQIKVDGTY